MYYIFVPIDLCAKKLVKLYLEIFHVDYQKMKNTRNREIDSFQWTSFLAYFFKLYSIVLIFSNWPLDSCCLFIFIKIYT